jgi:hypothetical protein
MLGWQIAAYWAIGLLLAAGLLWLLRPQGPVGRAAARPNRGKLPSTAAN